MYNVAQVIDEKCVAKKGCRLCIMYCPEANCLDLNSTKMVAEVTIDRCKGCELCVVVCNAAKHEAIEMQAVSATGQLMSHKGESAGLGQGLPRVASRVVARPHSVERYGAFS
jgi:pyruvate ferredoxin oxidoreductase delta subunit